MLEESNENTIGSSLLLSSSNNDKELIEYSIKICLRYLLNHLPDEKFDQLKDLQRRLDKASLFQLLLF